jgi:plastocyanin
MPIRRSLLPPWLLVMTLLATVPSTSLATRHIVTFVCCSYTPSSFQATVGDTVVWQGDFPSHPLQSTTIPSGAPSFSSSSGTTFSYRIQVAGTYNYLCVFHQPSMAGSFTAQPGGTGVDDDGDVVHRFELSQNYPNPFNPETMIRFELPGSGFVSLKVFDVRGEQVATVVDEYQAAGSRSIRWNASGIASGIYFYELMLRPSDSASPVQNRSSTGASPSKQFRQVRKMVLVR